MDVEAILTFGNGTLMVTVENMETNPTSDVQNVNGISFDLSGLTSSNVTLTSFSSTDINNLTQGVAGPPSGTGWTTSSDTTNNWNITTGTGTFDMTTLGNAMAKWTIIGGPNPSDDEYTNANGSITNGTHEPFLWETATWTFSSSAFTTSSAASDVMVAFGTATGVAVPGNAQTSTPEPGSLGLAAIGLGAVVLGAIRRRSSRA